MVNILVILEDLYKYEIKIYKIQMRKNAKQKNIISREEVKR